MPGYDDDLRFAHVLADAADDITMRRFRATDLRVDTKPDLTPVSDADHAAEESLRGVLRRARPRDAMLGEEFGRAGGSEGSTRCWVIDPIDGTKNYVRGVPVWATLIALMEGAEVVVGVVSAPALARRWWAALDGGAWTGRSLTKATRCRVSGVSDLADASLSYSGLSWGARQNHFLGLASAVWRTRAFGDFWSHVLVAEGAVDIAAEPEVSLWDLAALQIIVEEAGGVFTDLDGKATPDGGSAVSTNGLLHGEVLRRLTPAG